MNRLWKAFSTFQAALKAYDKVLQLDPDNLYANLQIGSIKSLLGYFDEARKAFEDILKLQPDNVPALKGKV